MTRIRTVGAVACSGSERATPDRVFGATHSGAAHELKEIGAPLLLLHGPETALDWFTQGVRHVAKHVAGAEVRAIDGAGHCVPVVEPAAVANELVQFFALEAVQAR